MRITRFSILIGLVLVSFGALLLAGGYAVSLTHFSRLEAGERGVVQHMLDKNMTSALETYHLGQVKALAVSLPPAPARADAPTHPQAERFFYADAQGNVTIKGLSDKNVPPDLSQKCLLFADSGLSWYSTRLLLDALLNERIRYVYLAGLTPEGHLSYTLFEIIEPGPFTIYPYCVCIFSADKTYYYYENEEEASRFTNLDSFKKVAAKARELSSAEKPFLRFLGMDSVTVGTVHRTLGMFEPAGVQAIVILRSEDRKYTLAAAAELVLTEKEQQQEEEDQ